MNKNLMINGVIVLAAVVTGFALSTRPWEVYREQRLLADQEIHKMNESEAKHEALVRKEAKLRSSIGKEELARERGWLPANEKPAAQ